MAETPYTKRAATYDQGAARAYLRCTRGDTFEMYLDIVSEHPDPANPGAIITTPVDVSDLSWDSVVVDNAGTVVASFTITDDAHVSNRVRIVLPAPDTAAMTPGHYGFWVDAVNTTNAHRRTWLVGEMEILRKEHVEHHGTTP